MKNFTQTTGSWAGRVALGALAVAFPAMAGAQTSTLFADDAVTYNSAAPPAPQASAIGADAAPMPEANADPNVPPAPDPTPMGAAPAPAAQAAPAEPQPGGQINPDAANGGEPAAPPRRVAITPYIEVGQIVFADISPATAAVTYTTLAGGVDATLSGHNTLASASLRYERVIGYGNSASADIFSGLARGATQIVPHVFQIDYGAFGTRADIGKSGAALPYAPVGVSAANQVWSVFAGPSLHTETNTLDLAAHYHFGFTQKGGPLDSGAPGAASAPDSFGRASVHDAGAAIGLKPGALLPVGLGAEGGYYHEDISLLGQRITNEHIRGIVTVPVTPSLQLVGGVGAEHVKVTSYQAALDGQGNPLLDAQGHYISNEAAPRIVAYDTSGLIWDAGVVWRPSPRTALEMHFGRRYGAYGAWGNFSWTPNPRNAFNLHAYDDFVGFGGNLTGALVDAPTAFTAVRDPITGNLSSCVATTTGGGCIASVLGAINGLVYRNRGVTGQYVHTFGRAQAGLGAGYDNREYVTAPGSILAGLNGKADQYYWVAAFASDEVGQRGTLLGTVDVYRFDSGLASTSGGTGVHASASYLHRFSRHLTSTASIALDGLNTDAVREIWAVSGALALRYSF